MRNFRDLITAEPRARRLLAAHVQSSLGTGAAYVALLVVAYERFESPFAVSAILLSEILPAILLGAVFGAAADRWSRRTLLVAADLVRAIAFLGLFLVGSFEATVAFAVLAGAGQAAFQPTVMATLGDVVSEKRLPAATGLYGAIGELGYTAGPVLAAGAFLLVGAGGVLLANAVTFVLSALLLAGLQTGRGAAPARKRFFASIADGARALRSRPAAWTVVLSSTAFVCFLGAVNVAELVLVRETLGGSQSQYALIVAAMGLGITAGSLLAGRGTEETAARHYLAGLVLCGVACGACALAPAFGVALAAFAALGIGNGLALVSENVLLQQLIPAEVKGRVFGLKGSLIAAAFAVAYFGGGALAAAVGARAVFVALGAGMLLVWVVASAVLRAAPQVPPAPADSGEWAHTPVVAPR